MSSPANQTPPPSPERILQTMFGHMQPEVLKAGIDLDLFTAVGEGCDTVPSLAARVQGTERGVEILADALTVMGFLQKQDGRYSLSPDSAAFLNRRSPMYLGGMAEFLLADVVKARFNNLAETVRNGFREDDHAGLSDPNDELWGRFARGMGPLMVMPAQMIANVLGVDSQGPMRVLDIAAGHGMYGLTIATRNPNAQVVGLDWPNVAAVARENAEKMGVADRYSTITGNVFEVPLEGPYDVVLVTGFLHHFDMETIISLMRKVADALKPGGRTVVLDFVPNDDRVSPPMPALFSVQMLAGTPSGRSYTFTEYDRMLQEAGFAPLERHDIPGPQTVLVARKA